MAFSMSGVSDGYSYNRFDIYEKKSKDCDCKSEKDCDCDDKKSKGKGPRWQDSDGDGKWYEPGEDVAEGMMPLPKEKMARQADKAYGKEQRAVRAGDEKETNKQMQRRIAMKDPAGRKNQLMNKEDYGYSEVYEARKEGESPQSYADRMTKKHSGGKSKTYDPMKDSSFDHDEAEKTRGQSGKMKKEELEAAGLFSEEEISTILEALLGKN